METTKYLKYKQVRWLVWNEMITYNSECFIYISPFSSRAESDRALIIYTNNQMVQTNKMSSPPGTL